MSDVLFVTAGPYTWGSSRMRAYWVAEKMGASAIEIDNLHNHMEEFSAAKSVIWQKSVDVELIESAPEKRHFWDVCDPVWWWSPSEARESAGLMHGIVCSSPALALDFQCWYTRGLPVSGGTAIHMIPDRLNLDHFPLRQAHADHEPVRFIWYGVAVNRSALHGAIINLARLAANGHKIELTVFDDRPDVGFQLVNNFPIRNLEWNLERENEVISSHDIALLPDYPGAWGRVKSNNKKLTAAACGLPVTNGEAYESLLEMVASASARQIGADKRRKNLIDFYQIEKSVEDWKRVLDD